MQAPIKTTLFYPPSYYKSLHPQGELNEQYQNKVAIVFLEKKHNVDTTRKDFPIEIYMGGPPYELYFIALTLQGKIIIRSTKKIVASYVVGDLALLDQFIGI